MQYGTKKTGKNIQNLYFMSFNWDLVWTILQVVALLIIAREIDKRIRKRKNK